MPTLPLSNIKIFNDYTDVFCVGTYAILIRCRGSVTWIRPYFGSAAFSVHYTILILSLPLKRGFSAKIRVKPPTPVKSRSRASSRISAQKKGSDIKLIWTSLIRFNLRGRDQRSCVSDPTISSETSSAKKDKPANDLVWCGVADPKTGSVRFRIHDTVW